MQTITQNQFAAPSTVGTTDRQTGNGAEPFCLSIGASHPKKMLFAFVSSIVFTLIFLVYDQIFTVKERWMLPLIGIL